MTDQNFEDQDPLDALLDAQSDQEFGTPSFREHLDGEQSPLVLKNWTAQDFSDIYVRFHPHLLRHAKRYLTNHSQAEEVVQDAFLYLMTSLPEIDTETGALKLLKWKVRLLSLDVIASNSKVSFAPIDHQFDLEAKDDSIDKELMRADESAIVSLALAKLLPRQREALIASIYQEKSTLAVAQQLGINENATKQLIHRAKGAFKKALIGEAQTRGLSLSQILSIAARKASQDAGKYISVASATLLVLALSIGVIPNLGESPASTIAQVSDPEAPSLPFSQPNPNQPEVVTEPGLDLAASGNEVIQDSALQNPADSSETRNLATSAITPSRPAANIVSEPAAIIDTEVPVISEFKLLGSLGSLSSRDAGFAFPLGNQANSLKVNFLLFSKSGLSAYVDISSATDNGEYRLGNPVIQIETDMGLTATKIGDYAVTSTSRDQGTTLTLVASELILVDPDGVAYAKQSARAMTVTLVVELDRRGQPIQASIFAQ